MNIAVFLDNYFIGGVEKVFITLANEWASTGYNVYVFILQQEGDYKGDLDERINIIELGCSRLLKSFFVVPRLLRQYDIDYFMVGKDGNNIFFILSKLITRFKSKLIISQHNYLYFEGKADSLLYRTLFPKAMKLLYKYADHIICVSKGIEEYVKTLNIKKNQTTVINNPMDIKKVMKDSNEPIDEEGKFIIFCGRLSPVKNIDLLIKGFKIFYSSYPEYKLLILGSGREETRLKSLVSANKIDACVRFVGSVSNPHRYVSKSQVLVLPSFTEAFPMVICEAFVTGTTVVSTHCGGPDELLQDGRGYFVNSFDDAQEMALTLIKACNYPINKDLMRNYVKQFDTVLIANKYIETFTKIH